MLVWTRWAEVILGFSLQNLSIATQSKLRSPIDRVRACLVYGPPFVSHIATYFTNTEIVKYTYTI